MKKSEKEKREKKDSRVDFSALHCIALHCVPSLHSYIRVLQVLHTPPQLCLHFRISHQMQIRIL